MLCYKLNPSLQMTKRIESVCLHGVLCRIQYYLFQLYHGVSCVSLPVLRASRTCNTNLAIVSARIYLFFLFILLHLEDFRR